MPVWQTVPIVPQLLLSVCKLGVGDGVGVGVAVGVAVGVGEGLTLGDAELDAVGLGESDGLALGAGVTFDQSSVQAVHCVSLHGRHWTLYEPA